MEEIGTFLKPHAQLFGRSAVYLAVLVNLNGFSTCFDIYKKGSTANISSLVFVTNVMMGVIKYKTGILLQDDNILDINTAIILLNCVFCFFYYVYASDKWNEIIKQFSIWVVVAGVMWRYTEWEDPSVVHYRYGLTVTVLTLTLMLSPALATKNVIKSKNASQISVVWTFLSLLFAFSTILYSSAKNIKFMLIQSSAAFLLSLIRLLLTFVYPREATKINIKNKSKKNKKKKQKKE